MGKFSNVLRHLLNVGAMDKILLPIPLHVEVLTSNVNVFGDEAFRG